MPESFPCASTRIIAPGRAPEFLALVERLAEREGVVHDGERFAGDEPEDLDDRTEESPEGAAGMVAGEVVGGE